MTRGQRPDTTLGLGKVGWKNTRLLLDPGILRYHGIEGFVASS